MSSHRKIAELATDLASRLPTCTVESVAEAIATSDPASLRAEIAKRVPHHHHRGQALTFVDKWQTMSPNLDANVVAVALLTASSSQQKHRDLQSVELVWTGPEGGNVPLRRTEQAILQLLDSAQNRITLVSFAVYSIPNIAAALVKAARRGVKLTVIVETPDRIGGENEYSTLRALGPEVEACSSVHYWPVEQRKLSATNKPGILHVKCAVADGEWLFLSSANLTQQAFTINMELGMLVRGGATPATVERLFDRLIREQQLCPID